MIGISLATGLVLYSMIGLAIFTNKKFLKFYTKRIFEATKELSEEMFDDVMTKTEDNMATTAHMEIV